MTDCLFCAIISGQIPADVVYDDDQALAFRDIAPQAPVHILVIPRRHMAGIIDAGDEHEALLGHLFRIAGKLAEAEGVGDSGFRCVVNSGPDSQQSVNHLHVHVLGGREMSWPPG